MSRASSDIRVDCVSPAAARPAAADSARTTAPAPAPVPLATFAALAAVIAVPFFQTFLARPSLAAYLALFFLLAVSVVHAAACDVRIRMHVHLVLLLLFVVFALANNSTVLRSASGVKWFLMVGGLVLCLFLLAGDRDSGWERVALACMACFGVFYSLATIVLWLVPDLYDDVVMPFLRDCTDSPSFLNGYKSGLTIHYSTNAMYISLGLIASFALALAGPRLWGVASAVSLLALLLTTKRAHLVFAIAALCLVFLLWGSERKVGTAGKVALVGLAALAFVLFGWGAGSDVLAVVERFSTVADGTFGERIGFWKLCLAMWEQSPIFGCGWDSYTEAFNVTGEGRAYIDRGASGMDAHNVYLQVLAEEGIVGFALIAGALIGGIVDAARRLVALNRLEAAGADGLAGRRAVIAGSLAIQLFFAMYCVTGNPLYDIQMYVPWVLSLGMSCAATPPGFADALAGSSHAPRALVAGTRLRTV